MAMLVQNAHAEHQQGATVVSGTPTIILGPLMLANYVNKAFTVLNAGASTMSGAVIQINPDYGGRDVRMGPPANPGQVVFDPPNPALWETYDATSFQSFAPANIKTVFVNGSVARWWRIIGTAHLPSVVASGYLNATSV